MNPDCTQATDSFDLDEVVEAIDTWNAQFGVKHELRAQADARPVAWQVRPFDYGIGSEGVYARTDRPEQVEAWKRKGWEVQALYTHPEASAPGLSDDERDAIDRAIRLLVRECGATGTASHLRAILTRASAATVAEPSAYEHVTGPRVPEIDQVLAAQQQAEPGADERAAFEEWLVAHPYPITWRERGAFFAGYRAAQSGQRAGIPSDDLWNEKLILKIVEELNIMFASAQCEVDESDGITGYRVKTGALHRIVGALAGIGQSVSIPANMPVVGQRAGVAEGWKLVPVEPTDEWCRELATKAYGSGFVGKRTTLRFCGNVIRDVLAAAPTRQQEGGDV